MREIICQIVNLVTFCQISPLISEICDHSRLFSYLKQDGKTEWGTEMGPGRGFSQKFETLLFPFFVGNIRFPGNGIREPRPLTLRLKRVFSWLWKLWDSVYIYLVCYEMCKSPQYFFQAITAPLSKFLKAYFYHCTNFWC